MEPSDVQRSTSDGKDSTSDVARRTISFIGLGSNLGEREAHVWNAVHKMDAIPGIRVLGVSTLVETEPIGPVRDQPAFINAVAKIETELEPEALLSVLQEIERRMGRVRRERWGPRIIDLDILAYGTRAVDTETLRIPHPELPNRLFWTDGLKELGHML